MFRDCFWKDETASRNTRPFLEEYKCFWKDETVSGSIPLFLRDETVAGTLRLFLSVLVPDKTGSGFLCGEFEFELDFY